MSPGLSYFLAREMIQTIGVVPVCGLILKKHWAGYVGFELGSKTLWFLGLDRICLSLGQFGFGTSHLQEES